MTGDYVGMPRWNHQEKSEYHQRVKVVARQVYIQLGPGDMYRELDSYIVTLMVEDAKDAPDFRG